MSDSYVHYVLSLPCVLKRFGAWEGVKYIVGVGAVCGRRGFLLHVRFPQSTAWKLKSLLAFHM